jgi:hypothetical protein
LFANNLTTTANVEATYLKGDGSEITHVTLDQVVDYGNVTSNTIQLTNADVGLKATGNVKANYFVGNGSKLTGLVTDLQSVTDNGNTTSNTVQFTNATTALIADSNVGIGTSTPSANLHVMGYQYVNGPPTLANAFDHSDAPLTLTHGTPTSTAAIDDPKAVLHLTRDGTSGESYGARASFNLSRYENSGTASRSRLDVALADGTYAESTVMTLRADGKVGVGTDTPAYTLDVAGDINLSGDFYQGGLPFVSSLWTSGNDSLYYTTNNVGIGTNTAEYTLDVHGNANVGALTTTSVSGDGSALYGIQSSNVSDFASNVTRITNLETSNGHIWSNLESNVTTLRSEMASNTVTLRGDLQSNVTTLRSEMASNTVALRGDLQSNVTTLRDTAITFTGIKTFQNDVILESNLRVQGDLLVANTVNMTVSDPILELGSNNQNTGDIGLVMTRHGTSNSNVAVFFDETADALKLGYTLNGANDTTLELDSNALAVSVQGALTAASVSGDGSGLSALNASNLASGTVPSARLSLAASDIPSLDAGKITSGTLDNARLPSTINVTNLIGDGSGLSALNASNLASGTIPSARLSLAASDIPSLDAGKITSGTLDNARLNTASTTGAGIVQLSTSTSGTSTTKAATESAVKAAYDRNSWGSGTFSSLLNASGGVQTYKDGVVAEFRPETNGEYTLIKFHSKANFGSDMGFILCQDETTYSPGTGGEDLRMTIGVHNDFRQSSSHSDELWFQGGGRLVYNVGSWDSELNTIIGTPSAGTTGGHEWRVNDSTKMVITHAGNVGIGTASPGQPLHIYRSGTGSVVKIESATAHQPELQLYHTGDSSAWHMYMPSSSDSLHFYRNGDRMTLTSSGNVGIGTTNPWYKLDVNGEIGSSAFITSGTGSFSQSYDGVFMRPDGQVYISVDDNFYFRDNANSNSNRRHLFETNNGNVKVEGGYSSNYGLDYAEYFEWHDGNPNEEDRIGLAVSLVEETGKIKIAEIGETPIGAVSGMSGMSGGEAGIHWNGYWDNDDWGRPTYKQLVDSNGDLVFNEDGTPKMKRAINPAYDYELQKDYKPRSQRSEWACIGLLGQVYLRKESIKSNNWIKIKSVDEIRDLYLLNATFNADTISLKNELDIQKTRNDALEARIAALENPH